MMEKMNLSEKIELAKTCGNFNPQRSSAGNCNADGYAPFDCNNCNSYKNRAVNAGSYMEACDDEKL